MQDLPGKGLGLRCVSRQFRLFPDFSVILFSVIHRFCLFLRQWLLFSRKQRHRTTVRIDLTLDGHCHVGQPHLTSHTESPISHVSHMFHWSAFF